MSVGTAFVTGSTGFLGITLTQELVNEGWRVVAFHRPSSDITELEKLDSVSFETGDVTDYDSVLRAMPETSDAVFHAAGSVGFYEPSQERIQYETNVTGTRNVVTAAQEKKVGRVIYTSSVLTYDYTQVRRVDESTPPYTNCHFSYVNSKYLGDLEAEKAVEAGLDVVFIHPSIIFGAHDRETWSKMFREIAGGLRVPAMPPGGASVCHMREVARAHVSAFERGRRGHHYVLGGPDKTFREIAGAIATLIGQPGPRWSIPGWLFRSLGWVEYRISKILGREPMVTPAMAEMLCLTVLCSSAKAERELGYRPASLETMLEDCYQWMRSENMMPS
jgi:nucleoside-diphosphate-sugar epimerase